VSPRARAVSAAPVLAWLGALLVAARVAAVPACDPSDAGLRLPAGFCALEVGAGLGRVRHLAVAPNGDVFAALRAGRRDDGGVLALRDTDGDGRADLRRRFGRGDGHGIALAPGHLYYAAHDRVVRFAWETGRLEPAGPPEVIVDGFPEQREHRVKAIALGPDGALYVEVGAPSNSCQVENRALRSPGLDPCPQLEAQAGIWRYAADVPGQRHDPARRHATGLRHALALAVDPATGALWAAVNGRDLLGTLWGFDAEANAELPAEELVHVTPGADFGWPYCYHDGRRGRKVLAPEYGGDGARAGRCTGKDLPALAFPAHWAPMALAFYTARAFPERYRGGAFVAFRGSWNRAPLPQEGYRVVFVPFADGRPAGGFETFAIGAESPTALRMTGVAVGPDGSLYLAADANQRIWRVLPRGERAPGARLPAPRPAAFRAPSASADAPRSPRR
jgi:glucose/arabinose dehydrogenase